MSTTRRVGNLQTTEDKNGFIYRLQYFVLDTDKSTYTPYYGLAGNTPPFEFPAGTFIRWWKDEPYGDHWLITIEAVNNEYDEGQGGSGFGNDPDEVFKEYTIEPFYFDPLFYGVIKARKSHIDGGVLKDIYNQTAKEGSWIFENWHTDSPTFKGSPRYDQSPFGNADATKQPADWFMRKVPTVMLHVKFYTSTGDTSPLENYINWTGVNGPSGSAWNPGPADVQPTGYLVAGTWKTQYQKLKHKAKSFDGGNTYYDLVERKMLKAPGDLTWDKDMFNKSGTYWDWNGI